MARRFPPPAPVAGSFPEADNGVPTFGADTIRRAAERWCVSVSTVRAWIRQKRIPGARAVYDAAGRKIWLIPAGAPRPAMIEKDPLA